MSCVIQLGVEACGKTGWLGAVPDPRWGVSSRSWTFKHDSSGCQSQTQARNLFLRLISGVFTPARSHKPFILGSTQKAPDDSESLVKTIRWIR